MPRPIHQADPAARRQVETMAAYGVPEVDIARVVGIDPKTLRKHYRDELDTGHILATAKVAESLFRKATSDSPQSVTAAIFWLKTRGGWRETPKEEPAKGDADLGSLSEEELTELLTALRKITPERTKLPAPSSERDQDNCSAASDHYH